MTAVLVLSYFCGMVRLLLLLLLCCQTLSAQPTWDTTYYVTTKNRLNLGLVLSQRSYQIDLSSKNDTARSFSYDAYAPGAIGFIADYDKISLQVLFKMKAQSDPKKGQTRFSNLALAVGGNNILFEGGYRFFKGFYDESSANYINQYTDSTPYYQLPDLTANYIKIKGYYFTNRKHFSYKAVYSCGYRQIKSSSSWVLTANFLNERLAADSSLVPLPLREEYPQSYPIKGVSHFGLGAGIGYTATLVFLKRFFANLTFVPSIHLQQRKYSLINNDETKGYYGTLLIDSRVSLGYSAERFFVLFSGTNDRHWITGKSLSIQPSFISGTFVLGYRFNVENKQVVKKVKKSGLYQRL